MQTLTPKEVAARLKIGLGSVYTILHSGALPGFRPIPGGSAWRVTEKALEEYASRPASVERVPKLVDPQKTHSPRRK